MGGFWQGGGELHASIRAQAALTPDELIRLVK